MNRIGAAIKGVFLALLFNAAPFGAIARAAQVETYSPAALKVAQAAGKPVVVDVSATWCSTCKAQAAVVQSLIKEPRFKGLVVLDLDFDTQKAAMRGLNVRDRSTFVAYKGKQEVGRSTGDTDPSSIEQLFAKTN